MCRAFSRGSRRLRSGSRHINIFVTLYLPPCWRKLAHSDDHQYCHVFSTPTEPSKPFSFRKWSFSVNFHSQIFFQKKSFSLQKYSVFSTKKILYRVSAFHPKNGKSFSLQFFIYIFIYILNSRKKTVITSIFVFSTTKIFGVLFTLKLSLFH